MGECRNARGCFYVHFSKRSEEFSLFLSLIYPNLRLIYHRFVGYLFKMCFMIFFFCFERVLLAMRGCTCSLRECSRTLKTPNSPPLVALMDAPPLGLSHLRTAGGRIPAPQRTRKLRKIATSGKRRWIGRHNFYKKNTQIIFDQVVFEVTGGQKWSNFLKIGLFSQLICNYLNNYTN